MLFEYKGWLYKAAIFMKKLTILIIILFYGLRSSAFNAVIDTATQKSNTASTLLDSLKQQLQLTESDSVKSPIYTKIAAEYLKYDSITDKRIKLFYQNQALNYTYLALHLYSRYNDTIGERTCFNSLAKVYRSQKKYTQAKWFIIQSNSLSRDKKDIPNIMASLIEMAAIKMDIKDYSLAMRDLNEALKLSTTNHFPRVESKVQLNYALLYSHLNKYDKEAVALKRHEFIDDSIHKKEAAALIAKITAQDSLQIKKKTNSTTNKRAYRANYSRRIASL
ncbi:hypothetical protein [Mucilaginibacter sp.]|uniref:hypothetical protein n=1 Tax=Mucilaginibacter sp. TaxID=1882438 RepID=UPI00262D89B0|nr:hypothetical protein [Mucilaginibacter sp.]MDB5031924.1 hypothetical protein [Mucilaginibacter sp.]